ncbi:hypothetical protein KSP39_PZI023339 [Platanthera zijinensis]|uniref:Uncharacterized protein n=1 Tax=Platanthera zijinensis TaxID=2320716 RepID=A0AAP0AVD9_9ASPA
MGTCGAMPSASNFAFLHRVMAVSMARRSFGFLPSSACRPPEYFLLHPVNEQVVLISNLSITSSMVIFIFHNGMAVYWSPTPPAATTATTSTNLSAVPPSDYNDVYKKAKIADAKAMNILAQTMSDETFQKVADCTSAKAMWDSLNHIVAGSADERKDRRSNLTSQYENFKKTEAESVDAMYTRLSSIINELRTLDKEITLTEVNDKILMCFPST